jgi:hypothetical protein
MRNVSVVRKRWLSGGAVIPLSALLLLSCTTTVTPWVASGRSLDVLGEQFLATASAFDKGLEAGKVTPEQYKAWRIFGERFQTAYGPAVGLWQAARRVNDTALERDTVAIVARLAVELGGFAVQVGVAVTQFQKGAP